MEAQTETSVAADHAHTNSSDTLSDSCQTYCEAQGYYRILVAQQNDSPLNEAEMKTSVATDHPNDVAIVSTRELDRKQSSGSATFPLMSATPPPTPVAVPLLAVPRATSAEWQPKTTVPVATKIKRLVHTNSTKQACTLICKGFRV